MPRATGRITEQDIHDVAFSKPPIGKRGYNEDEVDAFLDAIEADVAFYRSEIDRLTNELEQARNAAPQHDSPMQWTQTFSPPEPPATAQAARILALAETTAQTLTDEAKSEADRTLQDAQSRAAAALSAAEKQASERITQARQEEEAYRDKIAALRTFEENYVERLGAYIAGQLEALRANRAVE